MTSSMSTLRTPARLASSMSRTSASLSARGPSCRTAVGLLRSDICETSGHVARRTERRSARTVPTRKPQDNAQSGGLLPEGTTSGGPQHQGGLGRHHAGISAAEADVAAGDFDLVRRPERHPHIATGEVEQDHPLVVSVAAARVAENIARALDQLEGAAV